MILECAIAKIRKKTQEELMNDYDNEELITEYFYKATNDFNITKQGQIEEISNIMPFALELSSSNKLKQIKIELNDEANDIIVFYKNNNEHTTLLMEKIPHSTPSVGATGLEEKSIDEFNKYFNKEKANMLSAYIMRRIIESKDNKPFIKRAINPKDYKKDWTIYIFEESGRPYLFPVRIENKCPEKEYILSPANHYIDGTPQIKINQNACDEIPQIKFNEDYVSWLGQSITGIYDYTLLTHNCRLKHITLEDRILLLDIASYNEKNYLIAMEVKNKKNEEYEQILIGNERQSIELCKEELIKHLTEFGPRDYLNDYTDEKIRDEWISQSILLQTEMDKKIAQLFGRI